MGRFGGGVRGCVVGVCVGGGWVYTESQSHSLVPVCPNAQG